MNRSVFLSTFGHLELEIKFVFPCKLGRTRECIQLNESLGFGSIGVCRKRNRVVGFAFYIVELFWCQKLVTKPRQKLKINLSEDYKDVKTLKKSCGVSLVSQFSGHQNS